MGDCSTLHYTRHVRLFFCVRRRLARFLPRAAYHNTLADAAMNVSGPPVSAVVRKTTHTPTSLIVLHDSIEHKPTALSLKFGGSANGHNGIRSLITALSTKDFYRLRLGIGRPESDVADYVLGRLPNFERQFWAPDGPGLELVWEQIQRIALGVGQGPS
jgi:PTH1 family peptidyl-tRNA hydrolase